MQVIIFSDVQPFLTKNAGAYRIATELRNAGYEVLVIEWFQQFSLEDQFKFVDKFVTKDTLWAGFSTTFTRNSDGDQSKYYNDLSNNTGYIDAFMNDKDVGELCKYIKGKNKNTQIIMGGTRADAIKSIDRFTMEFDPDYYFMGNSDAVIVPFTDWLAGKGNKPIIINDNELHGKGIYDVKNFHQLAIKYHKWDFVTPNEYIPIELARGCIFKCKFCNYDMLGKKMGDYTKDIDVLVDEIIYNSETHNTRNYMLSDETLNDSMEKVSMIHELSQRLPFKIRFGGYARLDLYNANMSEMPYMMKEAGLKGHCFGIETFNKDSGKLIGKGLGEEKIKACLTELRKIWGDDVLIETSFISGLPDDNFESFIRQMRWIVDKNSPVDLAQVHALTIYRNNNALFGDLPEKYGYSFPNNYNQFYWERGDENFHKAIEWARLAWDMVNGRMRQGWWGYSRLINLDYYTEEDLRNRKISEYPAEETKIALDRKLLKYKNFLLSL